MFVLAILFDAPLNDIANPNATPEVAKAPWYFAGLQELLSHVQPMVAGVIVPTAALLWLLVPAVPRPGHRVADPRPQGRRRRVQRDRRGAARAHVVGTFFRGPGWSWVWPWHHLYVEL